jgi:hypothetical protein
MVSIFLRFSHTKFPLAVLFLIFGSGIMGCITEPNPYKSILRNNYYSYALPNDVLEEQGWRLVPIEQDWDAHCKGGTSAPWNPLDIWYLDQDESLQFSLRISNRDVIWHHENPTEEVALDSPWVKNGIGVKYRGEDISPIKFFDIFDNEVVVSSDLNQIEMVSFINRLEYIGASPDKSLNPWSQEWCEARLPINGIQPKMD